MIGKFKYIFVNALEISEKDVFRDDYNKQISHEDYFSTEPSVKIRDFSPKNVEETVNDLFDSQNRKIMQGQFQMFSYRKIVLAYHSLVVPAYLIEIEEKTSVDDIVKGTLYSGLKLKYLLKKVMYL